MNLKWLDPQLLKMGFPRAVDERSLHWFEAWLDSNPNAGFLVFERGQTLAHYLALAGVYDWMDTLGKRGAHLTGLNSFGEAPLHIFSMDSNSSGIFSLIRNSVDVESRDGDGGTLLHVASRCTSGHVYEYREPAWPIDSEKISSFIWEMFTYHPGLLESVDKAGQTPLFSAARAASCYELATPILRKLLSLGANPNAQDENGCTATHEWARDCQRLEALELLLEFGADKALRNKAGQTPLEVVAQERYSHKPIPKAISRCLNPGG
jgi:ankyrin repeat protein